MELTYLHGYEGIPLLVAVDIVGVDVVRLHVIVVPPEDHPRVVITQHVCITVLKKKPDSIFYHYKILLCKIVFLNLMKSFFRAK